MAERERPWSDRVRESDPWEPTQPELSSDDLRAGHQLSRLEQELARLQAEVDHLRADLAEFEGRYRMSLDEFRARLSPDAELHLQEDCWDWARCAEQCRQLCLELEKIRERLCAGKLQAVFHKPPEREHKAELKGEPIQAIPTPTVRAVGFSGHGLKRKRS